MTDETKSWYDALPEELQSAPFFKPTDDGPRELSQVVSDITNAAQWMGNSIRIPGKDAGDEAMAEFRQKATEKIPGLMVIPSADDTEKMQSVFRTMGMPENSDDYKLPDIEGLKLEEGQIKALKDQSHALNMTQAQFAQMVQAQHEQLTAASESQKMELDEGIDALKREWGAAYDQKVGEIRTLLGKIEAPEYIGNMLEAGTLPASDLKMFQAMADMIGAEASEVATQEAGPKVLTPDEALSQLSEIENRADNALWDATHPDHKRLVKKRNELMLLAYPDSSTDSLRSSWGG